jgi:predicted permease
MRALWRQPRHVVTIVVCLGVGLTACVSVFSILNSLLHGEIRGIADRHSLVRLSISHDRAVSTENLGRAGAVDADPLSVSDDESLEKDPGPSLTTLAAEGTLRVAVSLESTTTSAIAAFVSPEYFPTLRTPVHEGRLLTADDSAPNAPPVVVVGVHLWQDRLGSASDIVGRQLLLGGRAFTVVGVAPSRFFGLEPGEPGSSPLDHPQLWLPLRQADHWPSAPGLDEPWLNVAGRLGSGLTIEDSRRSLVSAGLRRSRERSEIRANAAYVARPDGFSMDDAPVGILLVMAMLLAVPLTVLAVACANVANLQLARATTRAREIAVRLSIGASRGQVLRLLSLETAILAIAATVAGWLGSAAVMRLVQDAFPLVIELDNRVLVFAIALAVIVTVLSGLAPAWIATRRSMVGDLKHTIQGGGLPHARLRHALVVVQVAASLVLLVGSGLFVRMSNAVQTDIPQAIREQVVVAFDFGMLGYREADTRRFLQDLRTRLDRDPRIQAGSIERNLSGRFSSPGAPAARFTRFRQVTTAWPAVTDARLVAGRWLDVHDEPTAVVVNERLADVLAPDGPAVGRQIVVWTNDDDAEKTFHIVGVIANQRRQVDDWNPSAEIYSALVDQPDDLRRSNEATHGPVPMAEGEPVIERRVETRELDLRIRTRETAAVTGDLRRLVREIDPRLPWAGLWSGPELYAGEFDSVRKLALAIGTLGALALLLAAAGLHAVMRYVVSLRQHEFGVRLAIGASAGDLMTIVGRLAVRLTAVGLTVGLLITVPLAFLFRSMLVGVTLPVFDPWAWLPIVAMLALVTIVAALGPARRAARVDPLAVLKAE